jgi:glutamyl-tRNA(Gln) amidotransferase subunit D
MSEMLKGYKGEGRELLEKYKVNIWDIIQIKTAKTSYEGIILPRSEYSASNYINIKLNNNYNVGIKVSEIKEIKKIGKREASYKIPEKEFPKNKDLPNVTLLGTGGTVASRLDYTTGAVIPSFTPGELFSAVPELAEICNLECEMVFEILSENMKHEYWQKLAKKVEEAANSGIDGIMIGHGTDTMSFTSAALSFMLKDLSIPVVVVGSQRSSDRPSSDAALNLINAATVASSDIAEVVVSMMGSSSHDYSLIHRGTLVRKMHSSVTLTKFENKITLIYSYPEINNELIDFYVDKGYKGIVLAGTGLGHVPTTLYDSIERAIQEEITILMTTQTLHGFVGMNVYSTGRELQNMGVIPGRKLLLQNIAGEFIDRELPIAFNYNIDELLRSNKL